MVKLSLYTYIHIFTIKIVGLVKMELNCLLDLRMALSSGGTSEIFLFQSENC